MITKLQSFNFDLTCPREEHANGKTSTKDANTDQNKTSHAWTASPLCGFVFLKESKLMWQNLQGPLEIWKFCETR